MEFLKGVISDETYNKLAEELKENKNIKLGNLATGAYISKEKFDTQKTELDNTKELLTNANKEIDSYKSMDIDAIKKSAEDYKTKYETAESDYKAKIADMELNNKLEKYVDGLNLKNDIYKKEVVSRIKEKELKFDGDILLGGEELVKGFKEQYAEAFNDTKPKPTFSDTTPGSQNTTPNTSLRLAMGLPVKE